MMIFDSIGEDILRLLYGYVAAKSVTGSAEENSGADFFIEAMSEVPYFKAHPDNLIRYPIAGDSLKRDVCAAMLRGKSPDTVVMIHHFDVTSTEDYGRFASVAFDPDALIRVLRSGDVVLEQDALNDLNSGDFIFGHGVCDMKGGGAIQMSLLSRLSEIADFPATLLLIGIPDEENLSAGMRAAVSLLSELKEKHGLNYKLMINSEPHQRKDPQKGVFSIGSTGKLLPFIYVKGRMSHAGKSAEGINPLAVASRIVAATEGLPFTDDGAPTPTWLMLRDDKLHYDVSMPRSVFGCMSVLSFHATVSEILGKLRKVCEAAFDDCIDARTKALGIKRSALPWNPRVYSWTEVLAEVESIGGEEWKRSSALLFDKLERGIESGEMCFADAYRLLLEFTVNELPDVPLVVFGLMPPYYPAVTNGNFAGLPESIANLGKLLNEYSVAEFGQEYEIEEFYTGISDLSYSSLAPNQSREDKLAFIEEVPMYAKGYTLNIDDLMNIAMPCINIGPWGKDFHKLTERVCLSDLVEKTPKLLHRAIQIALGI
ncbi:MAG TPA: M20/M25/M40 family metallo-hydrolase [Bacillota bacterium]|nr:M20/M25/M40 family metallo-hydrolase [Bacillota bacterium]